MGENQEEALRERVWGRCVLCALLAVALLVPAGIVPATAAADEGTSGSGALSVTGVDFMQPRAEAWEVLRVDGAGEGDALYLTVTKAESVARGDGPVTETPLLSRMKYVPADETAAEGEGAQTAHIVSLNLGGASPWEIMGDWRRGTTFRIEVHDAPRGGELLYAGTVYPVYAKLADGAHIDGYELIGIRTTADADGDSTAKKNVGAGATFYRAAEEGTSPAAYRLAPPNEGADNGFDADIPAFVAPYERVAEEAISGSIQYVTDEGEIVRTDAVPDIGAEGVERTIERSFLVAAKDADGAATGEVRYFRAVSNLTGSTVRLTVQNAHRTVRVVEVPQLAENAYGLTMRYVDQDGALLWSDSFDVKGYGYQYTLPTTFSMHETDGVAFYTLEDVCGAEQGVEGEGRAAAKDWDAPTVKFDHTVSPEEHFLKDDAGSYYLKARYVSSDVTRKATLTLVAIDGSTGQRLPEAEQPGSFTVTPESPAMWQPAAKVIDGVTYVPWSGNSEPITYAWDDLATGVDLLQYVYYVPEGYVPDEAYDITVQYLNIANGAVLRTDTLTVDPEMTDYLTVVGDERFTAAGNEYVRLAGQESGIRHSYFTPQRTYTVYYRDVNDVINSEVVIRRTQIIETERVVEVPGATTPGTTTATTTVTAAPVTAVAPTPAAAPDGGAAPAAAPTVDAGVTAGDGAAVINDDDNPLANGEGVDTSTERAIADSETPLAAGEVPSEEGADASVALAVGVLATALGVGVLTALWWWRRQKRELAAASVADSDRMNE